MVLKRMGLALVAMAALGAAPAAAFDWTGFYAGLGVGGLNGGYSDEFGGSILYDGVTLDGFAGVRAEVLMFTLGAEVDASYFLPLEREASGGFVSTETAMIGKVSARGTLGTELGPLLPYLTAGVTMASQKHDAGPGREDTVNHTGIVVGAGVDIGITDHAFARLEANYSIFADESYDLGLGPYMAGLKNQTDLRAGIGWKF